MRKFKQVLVLQFFDNALPRPGKRLKEKAREGRGGGGGGEGGVGGIVTCT